MRNQWRFFISKIKTFLRHILISYVIVIENQPKKSFLNEKILIQKCKQNKHSAQLTVYKMYKNMMFNACLRIVRSKHDAEDIVQESFIKGFQKIGQLQEEANLGAWLKRIVVNASLDFVRKKKNEYWIEESFIPEEKEEELSIEEDKGIKVQLIKDCLEEIKEKYRIILVLYMIEDYNHREIGEMLNLKESTVRNQYRRGKKLLIEMIQNRTKDEVKTIHTGT